MILTNKRVRAKTVVAFHDGRGSQEGVFGGLKSQCQMGYVPVRTLVGNQLYLLAGLFAHNLTRELQMATSPRCGNTTEQRATLWVFERLETLRRTVLQRAGRLTRPGGTLTLTVSGGETTKNRLLQTLARLQEAA